MCRSLNCSFVRRASAASLLDLRRDRESAQIKEAKVLPVNPCQAL